MFFKLASVPCPVISVVQGAAIGGGFGIAACSDFVLAEKTLFFRQVKSYLVLFQA